MRSESTAAAMAKEPESTSIPEVSFPAGNSDFRAVRNQCARACREFNSTPDDADPEERSRKWLDIVRPDRNRDEDGVAVTHDQTFANPALKAKTPFVKPPLYVDYGTRLHVGGSTFINRGCTIMDTPVADVVIGEGCNIGPNCTIIGVSHPLRLDERQLRHSIGQPVTIGNDVWIGANVTILGGVTIGDGAVIGACSLVKRDIPPMTIAFGSPARVVGLLKDVEPSLARVTAETLAEATGLRNRLPMTRLRQRHGFEEDAVVVDRVPGDRFDDELTVLPDSSLSFSDRRSSSNTLRSDGLGSDGEMRMLMALRQREQRLRRCEGNVLAAGTVIATLFIAFFFAGVYLGATRGSVFGGRD